MSDGDTGKTVAEIENLFAKLTLCISTTAANGCRTSICLPIGFGSGAILGNPMALRVACAEIEKEGYSC